MIAVNLSGGLGNQMFQYAFGKCQAERWNTRLLLDTRAFAHAGSSNFDANGLALRQYELGCFKLTADFLSETGRAFFFPNTMMSKAKGKIDRVVKYKALVFESGYGYDETILRKVVKNTYLYGHWQSYLYFDSISDRLLADFNFVLPSNRNIKLEMDIENHNSVSIHVRRGDYISSARANAIHGTCPLNYYVAATDAILKKESDVRWFVFSDDIPWCESAFTFLQNVTFASSRLETPAYYEMYLMSKCKHNIIANSSFSWWGAWLNRFPTKIVISPIRWFSDGLKNRDTDSLIPKNWTRL